MSGENLTNLDGMLKDSYGDGATEQTGFKKLVKSRKEESDVMNSAYRRLRAQKKEKEIKQLMDEEAEYERKRSTR